MNKVGEVVLVLNDKFVVAKTTTGLIIGSEVLVYKEIAIGEQAQSVSGLTSIELPKGKMKVISMQSENTYLLSVVTKDQAEMSDVNQTLALSLSAFNTIFGEKKEGENPDGDVAIQSSDEVAPYSAKIDTSSAMNVDFNPLTTYGDAVSFQFP